MVDSINGLPPGLEHLALKNDDKTANKELGQDEFLKLMTTQLQNQNPLEPMENGDFLGQMAQFGTVNGITELQKTVQNLTNSLQSNQALQASTMVGRTVLVEKNVAVLGSDAQGVKGSIDLPASSGEMNLTITDASGQAVRHINMGGQQAGLVDFVWDGLDDGGNALPPGNYGISAEATFNNENVSLQTLVRAKVDSVTLQRDGSSPKLNLADLGSILLENVRQVM